MLWLACVARAAARSSYSGDVRVAGEGAGSQPITRSSHRGYLVNAAAARWLIKHVVGFRITVPDFVLNNTCAAPTRSGKRPTPKRRSNTGHPGHNDITVSSVWRRVVCQTTLMSKANA